MTTEHQRVVANGLRRLVGRIERGEIVVAYIDSGQHNLALHYEEPGGGEELVAWHQKAEEARVAKANA